MATGCTGDVLDEEKKEEKVDERTKEMGAEWGDRKRKILNFSLAILERTTS